LELLGKVPWRRLLKSTLDGKSCYKNGS
jgi:hypothetical protein